MKKIISIQNFPCGYETFRLSELYPLAEFQTETLPINVLLLEHKNFGHILINTGCTEILKKNPLAYSKYLLKHKLHFQKEDSIISHLAKDQMDPLCIKKVLLTHANPECCGALPLIPRYELMATAQLLCVLKMEQSSHSSLKSTIPPNTIPIKAFNIFKGETFLKNYFPFVYDTLGDGSILAVDISGAANAMVGYFIPEKNIFFAADAAVDERVLDNDLFPSKKLLAMQHNADDYLSVIATLRRCHRENPDIRFIFSHSKNIIF